MWGWEGSTSTSDTESLENDDKSSFEVKACGSSKLLCCRHQKICPVNRPSTNLQNLVLLSLGNLHENQNNGHMPTQVSSLRLSLGSSTAARALWDSLDCRQSVLLSWSHSLASLTLSLVASTDLLGELIERFCQNTLFSKKNGSTAMSEAIFWYRI